MSWLDLELYALGELPGGEVEVSRHLQGCEVCRQCLESIRADQTALPALPALPALVSAAAPKQEGLTAKNAKNAEEGTGDEHERGSWWGWLRWALAPAAVAMAAVLLVLLLPDDPTRTTTLPPRRVAIKGGELALTLVRRRGEVITQDPRTFAAGDGFKVEVTCPPGQVLGWEVVVFQAGEATFPFSPAGPLICGNREPLAGAFSITDTSRADICLVVGAPDRAALSRGPGHLPPSSACVSVEPIP